MSRLLKTVALVFGFVPGLIIAYFSVKGLLRLPQSFLEGNYLSAVAMTGFHLLIFIGVATLLRYIVGTDLNRIRVGSLAGLIGMLIFVAAPFVRMFLVHVDIHEPPVRSGWDTYGLSVMFSVVATGPMVVLLLLALSAWTNRFRGTVRS